jgi:hypothetical protein
LLSTLKVWRKPCYLRLKAATKITSFNSQPNQNCCYSNRFFFTVTPRPFSTPLAITRKTKLKTGQRSDKFQENQENKVTYVRSWPKKTVPVFFAINPPAKLSSDLPISFLIIASLNHVGIGVQRRKGLKNILLSICP